MTESHVAMHLDQLPDEMLCHVAALLAAADDGSCWAFACVSRRFRSVALRTFDGDMLLLCACWHGCAHVVQQLLASGHTGRPYRIRVVDPIQLATRAGHVHVIKLLLADRYENADFIPAFFADEQHDASIALANDYGRVETLKLLLSDGCSDPTVGDNFAIRTASEQGFAEVVALLLADGRADPTARNHYAIRIANVSGHHDVVHLLSSDAPRGSRHCRQVQDRLQ
ncbi:hypothetical protein LCGC14_3153180, partial [marine sediment metagenome]